MTEQLLIQLLVLTPVACSGSKPDPFVHTIAAYGHLYAINENADYSKCEDVGACMRQWLAQQSK